MVKRAGMYLLGPVLGSSPVKSIVQCLARKDGSDDFFTLKVHRCITINPLLFGVLEKFMCFVLQVLIRKLHSILDPGYLEGKSLINCVVVGTRALVQLIPNSCH
jgi:hypothetical protein